MSIEWERVKITARTLGNALRKAFPGIKFQVFSVPPYYRKNNDRPTIRVHYVDGPTEGMVTEIVIKEGHGEWISVHRGFSDGAYRHVAEKLKHSETDQMAAVINSLVPIKDNKTDQERENAFGYLKQQDLRLIDASLNPPEKKLRVMKWVSSEKDFRLNLPLGYGYHAAPKSNRPDWWELFFTREGWESGTRISYQQHRNGEVPPMCSVDRSKARQQVRRSFERLVEVFDSEYFMEENIEGVKYDDGISSNSVFYNIASYGGITIQIHEIAGTTLLLLSFGRYGCPYIHYNRLRLSHRYAEIAAWTKSSKAERFEKAMAAALNEIEDIRAMIDQMFDVQSPPEKGKGLSLVSP